MTTATTTCLFDNIIELPSLTQEGGKSNEWFTPSRYIEAAREVMGGIDLDPASCEMANQTVKAKRYYTVEDDGLEQEWYGRVWLNPPYSADNSQPNGKKSGIRRWVDRLVKEYGLGHISQAIALLTSQANNSWFQPLWEYPICFPVQNVRFFTPHGRCAKSNPAKATWKTNGHTYGTVFVYFGPNESRFIEIFSQFGTIAKRVSPPVVNPVNLSLWEEV
jgi:hypothetical protein